MEVISTSPALNLYDLEWPIWTYQEQLPPAKFRVRRGRSPRDRCCLHGFCRLHYFRAVVRRSLLFSNGGSMTTAA